MDFSDHTSDKKISITVRESGYRNSITVSGDNPNWVSGKFTQLQNILDAVNPQENLFLKYQIIFRHVVGITTGYFIWKVLVFVMRGILLIPPNPETATNPIVVFLEKDVFLQTLFLLAIYWVTGMLFLADPIINSVKKLYPSIEFNFGPEHLNINKKRRKGLAILWASIILPILINIISQIF